MLKTNSRFPSSVPIKNKSDSFAVLFSFYWIIYNASNFKSEKFSLIIALLLDNLYKNSDTFIPPNLGWGSLNHKGQRE